MISNAILFAALEDSADVHVLAIMRHIKSTGLFSDEFGRYPTPSRHQAMGMSLCIPVKIKGRGKEIKGSKPEKVIFFGLQLAEFLSPHSC